MRIVEIVGTISYKNMILIAFKKSSFIKMNVFNFFNFLTYFTVIDEIFEIIFIKVLATLCLCPTLFTILTG